MRKKINYPFLLILVLYIYLPMSWIVNMVKFCNQDFEKPYKSEIVHGVGLFFPPASAITAWL